jgi:hypothetical protein
MAKICFPGICGQPPAELHHSGVPPWCSRESASWAAFKFPSRLPCRRGAGLGRAAFRPERTSRPRPLSTGRGKPSPAMLVNSCHESLISAGPVSDRPRRPGPGRLPPWFGWAATVLVDYRWPFDRQIDPNSSQELVRNKNFCAVKTVPYALSSVSEKLPLMFQSLLQVDTHFLTCFRKFGCCFCYPIDGL